MALLILSIIFVCLGLICLFIPIFSGVVLIYLGLLVVFFERHPAMLTQTSLIVFGCLTLTSLVIDWLGQYFGAVKGQATRSGIIGGLIGLVFGILFAPLGLFSVVLLPPLGIIIGELISGRDHRAATKAGLYTLIGSLISQLIGIIIGLIILAWYIRGLF